MGYSYARALPGQFLGSGCRYSSRIASIPFSLVLSIEIDKICKNGKVSRSHFERKEQTFL